MRIMSKLGNDGTAARAHPTVKDKQVLEHRVEEVAPRLQTTQPNFGRVRWWFSCPRVLDGEGCVAAWASSAARRGATSPAAAASSRPTRAARGATATTGCSPW